MEGICFEVKPQGNITPSSQPHPEGSRGKDEEEEEEEEIRYRLTLAGSLAVHPQTTMAMLPWVVAEIRKPRLKERSFSTTMSGPQSLEVSEEECVTVQFVKSSNSLRT